MAAAKQEEQRRLYGDAKLIEALLEKLDFMEAAAGGWASVYRDSASGSFWLKTHTVAGGQGGGYLMLLKLPLPATEQLVQLALHTTHTDEAVAAILRLLDEEEVEHKDFRHLLLQQVEQQPEAELTKEKKERLVQIIKLSALDDPMNRRAITGKSMEDIAADAAYFSGIAARAQVVLERLAGL